MTHRYRGPWLDLQRHWKPTTFRWLPRVVPFEGGRCFCMGPVTEEQRYYGLCSCRYNERVGVVLWERHLIKGTGR